MIEFVAQTSPVIALAFSVDSLSLASVARDGNVMVFDPTGFPQTIADGISGCQCVGFLPDGGVAYGTAQGLSACRDTITVVLGDSRFRSATSFASVDATTLAVGTGNRHKAEPGEFVLLDLGKNMVRPPRFTEAAGVRSVTVHQPTRTVAWSNGSRQISVWEIMKPDRKSFNLTHSSPSIAFHPDGKSLAAAIDYGIRSFEIGTKHERQNFAGHKGLVTSIAFSPDGRMLASGSWDETVRLWDTETGQELGVYRWPTGKVLTLAISPDGTRIAAAGQTGRIVVWDLD